VAGVTAELGRFVIFPGAYTGRSNEQWYDQERNEPFIAFFMIESLAN
jgi:hypothetical protein